MSDKDIRPMTDEERQRAKERSDVNKAVRDAHKWNDKKRSDVNKERSDMNKIYLTDEELQHNMVQWLFLDDDTRARMMAWPHGWVFFSRLGECWYGIPHPTWGDEYIYRTKPAPVDAGKEHSDVVKERSDVGTIAIQEVLEHEDGSATYTFDMDEKAHKKLAELGLELAMTCVAYEMDIQEAMDHIRWLGVSKEVNDEGGHPLKSPDKPISGDI